MANGATHDQITLTLAKSAAIAALLPLPWDIPWPVAAGIYAGLWLSPDLDLAKCNARKRWRDFAWLGWIWWPYAKLIPHRSWASHAPIISTAGRLAYVGGLAFIVALAVGQGESMLDWVGHYQAAALAFATGLAIADTGHWAADRWG